LDKGKFFLTQLQTTNSELLY